MYGMRVAGVGKCVGCGGGEGRGMGVWGEVRGEVWECGGR